MSFEDDEYWDDEYSEYSLMPSAAVIQEKKYDRRTAPDPVIPTRRRDGDEDEAPVDELAARRKKRAGGAEPFGAQRPSWLDDPDFVPIDTSRPNLAGDAYADVDFNRPELGADFDAPEFPISAPPVRRRQDPYAEFAGYQDDIDQPFDHRDLQAYGHGRTGTVWSSEETPPARGGRPRVAGYDADWDEATGEEAVVDRRRRAADPGDGPGPRRGERLPGVRPEERRGAPGEGGPWRPAEEQVARIDERRGRPGDRRRGGRPDEQVARVDERRGARPGGRADERRGARADDQVARIDQRRGARPEQPVEPVDQRRGVRPEDQAARIDQRRGVPAEGVDQRRGVPPEGQVARVDQRRGVPPVAPGDEGRGVRPDEQVARVDQRRGVAPEQRVDGVPGDERGGPVGDGPGTRTGEKRGWLRFGRGKRHEQAPGAEPAPIEQPPVDQRQRIDPQLFGQPSRDVRPEEWAPQPRGPQTEGLQLQGSQPQGPQFQGQQPQGPQTHGQQPQSPQTYGQQPQGPQFRGQQPRGPLPQDSPRRAPQPGDGRPGERRDDRRGVRPDDVPAARGDRGPVAEGRARVGGYDLDFQPVEGRDDTWADAASRNDGQGGAPENSGPRVVGQATPPAPPRVVSKATPPPPPKVVKKAEPAEPPRIVGVTPPTPAARVIAPTPIEPVPADFPTSPGSVRPAAASSGRDEARDRAAADPAATWNGETPVPFARNVPPVQAPPPGFGGQPAESSYPSQPGRGPAPDPAQPGRGPAPDSSQPGHAPAPVFGGRPGQPAPTAGPNPQGYQPPFDQPGRASQARPAPRPGSEIDPRAAGQAPRPMPAPGDSGSFAGPGEVPPRPRRSPRSAHVVLSQDDGPWSMVPDDAPPAALPTSGLSHPIAPAPHGDGRPPSTDPRMPAMQRTDQPAAPIFPAPTDLRPGTPATGPAPTGHGAPVNFRPDDARPASANQDRPARPAAHGPADQRPGQATSGHPAPANFRPDGGRPVTPGEDVTNRPAASAYPAPNSPARPEMGPASAYPAPNSPARPEMGPAQAYPAAPGRRPGTGDTAPSSPKPAERGTTTGDQRPAAHAAGVAAPADIRPTVPPAADQRAGSPAVGGHSAQPGAPRPYDVPAAENRPAPPSHAMPTGGWPIVPGLGAGRRDGASPDEPGRGPATRPPANRPDTTWPPAPISPAAGSAWPGPGPADERPGMPVNGEFAAPNRPTSPTDRVQGPPTGSQAAGNRPHPIPPVPQPTAADLPTLPLDGRPGHGVPPTRHDRPARQNGVPEGTPRFEQDPATGGAPQFEGRAAMPAERRPFDESAGRHVPTSGALPTQPLDESTGRHVPAASALPTQPLDGRTGHRVVPNVPVQPDPTSASPDGPRPESGAARPRSLGDSLPTSPASPRRAPNSTGDSSSAAHRPGPNGDSLPSSPGRPTGTTGDETRSAPNGDSLPNPPGRPTGTRGDEARPAGSIGGGLPISPASPRPTSDTTGNGSADAHRPASIGDSVPGSAGPTPEAAGDGSPVRPTESGPTGVGRPQHLGEGAGRVPAQRTPVGEGASGATDDGPARHQSAETATDAVPGAPRMGAHAAPYMDARGVLHNLKPIGRLEVSGPDTEPRRGDSEFGSLWFSANESDDDEAADELPFRKRMHRADDDHVVLDLDVTGLLGGMIQPSGETGEPGAPDEAGVPQPHADQAQPGRGSLPEWPPNQADAGSARTGSAQTRSAQTGSAQTGSTHTGSGSSAAATEQTEADGGRATARQAKPGGGTTLVGASAGPVVSPAADPAQPAPVHDTDAHPASTHSAAVDRGQPEGVRSGAGPDGAGRTGVARPAPRPVDSATGTAISLIPGPEPVLKVEPNRPARPERKELTAADLDAIRWRLDGGTLREVVDDKQALRELGEKLDEPLADEADIVAKAGLLSVRAEVYRLLGELGMAAAASRLALAHAESAKDTQSMVIAQAELAHVLRLRGDFVEADRLFGRAANAPVPARLRSVVHENAGRCCFDQGRHMEALDHFARAVRLGRPDDTDLAERIGVCLEAVYIHVLRDGWGPYPRRSLDALGVSGPAGPGPAPAALDETTAEQPVVRPR